MPAVSFLKAPAFQDGHAGYSDPLDEQHFLVRVVNALQEREWREDTAMIIVYDDSDGWYDHQMPPIVNPSFSRASATRFERDTRRVNGPDLQRLQQGGQRARRR